MKCNHQFIKSTDASKMKGGTPADHRSGFDQGVLVICALCGEVRKIFEDGTIQIVVDKTKK